jgi:hypothetical protein
MSTSLEKPRLRTVCCLFRDPNRDVTPERIMRTPQLHGLSCLAAIHLLVAAGAVQAQSCEPIQFKRGHSSGTVRGIAPPDDVVCYELRTGADQRADVSVEGNNIMFSVSGLVDGRDQYSFATEKKTYRIDVGQLMRSISDEPFALTVSVR